MVYIAFFILSISIAFIADKSKKFKIPILCLSMLPTLILGSIRSVKIGPDNYLYFSDIFAWAGGYDSFLSFYKDMDNGDILSYFYFYFVRLFTSDYHWFCFATVFTSLLLIYIAVYKMRDVAPMWQALTIYYFLFYCPMLCFVRQSLALSVCILAMYYAYKDKWKTFIVLTGIAALFHLSSIFFALLIFLYVYLRDKKKVNRRIFLTIGMTVLTMFIVLYFLSDISNAISLVLGGEGGRASVLTDRYLSEDSNQSNWKHGVLMVIMYIPLIVLSLFSIKTIRKERLFPMWIFCLIGVLLEFLSMLESHIHRLSYYFIVSSMFVLPACSKKNSLILICTLLYLVAYFVKQIVFNGLAFSIPMNPYETDVLFFKNL